MHEYDHANRAECDAGVLGNCVGAIRRYRLESAGGILIRNVPICEKHVGDPFAYPRRYWPVFEPEDGGVTLAGPFIRVEVSLATA